MYFCKNENFKYFKILQSENTSRSAQIIINILNTQKIPYNIIFFDKNVYIFPRKHQNILVSQKFAFIELLGLVTLKSDSEFEVYNFEKYVTDIRDLWYEDMFYENIINIISSGKHF